jgi:hypothetical protein
MRKILNQHGDVIIKKIDKIPEGAKKISVTKGYVLEHGEGVHTHTLPDSNIAEKMDIYEKAGTLYLATKQETYVDHEEHGTQVIEIGLGEKDIERAWDYESEEEKRVVD